MKFHPEDLSSSAFLVTGGAGFIGSHITEYLLQNGAAKVRVLDNFSTGKKENIAPFRDHSAFELIEGDIRDPQTCADAVKGIQYVSHQAALGSVPRSIKDPVTTNNVNIGGFLNMLVAAKDGGVTRMVYAASSSTYGDSKELPKVEDRIGKPLSPYAITKYVNELYGNVFSSLYGFHTIGMRYFNVYGPRQDPNGQYAAVIPLFMTAAFSDKSPVVNGDGEQTRDFTFVGNAVQANIRALFKQGLDKHEVVNIAAEERTSLNTLWSNIAEITGTSVKPTHGPSRAGDVRDSLASVDKARQVIGYEPLVKVAEGLRLTAEWYRANK